MSDTSQGPGWWLASDGRWYPPDLHPDAAPLPPPPARLPSTAGFQPLKKTLAQWTQGAMWAVAGAQALLALLGFMYWSAFNSALNGSGSLDDALSAENNFNTFSSISGVLWLAGFVLLVVWSAQVHTTTTSLLPDPTSRKYSRAWSIGVWFIPIANLISTPQVIAENQKIAYAARQNDSVGESWSSAPVQPQLIWWWVLTAGGLIISQFGMRTMSDALVSNSEYLSGLTTVIVGSMIASFGVGLGARFLMDMNAKLTE